MSISCKKTFRLQMVLALTLFAGISQSHAEVVLDGSLGPSGSLAGPNFMIPDTVGQTRGPNLFHSFSGFNINSSQSATFTGPPVIDNVIGRVTGGNGSFIDGLLRSTIPTANLFLLNPSGVMFGPNASLDIDGSFHASTANYMRLADGGIFDATTPGNSVLTSAPPAAFGFLGSNPAPISVQGSTLEVPQGETLSLIGGDIDIDSALIGAAGGQINLVSVASSGEAAFNSNGVDTAGFTNLGNIDLNNSDVITSGDAGGTVFIRSGQLMMTNTFVFADSVNQNGAAIGIDIKVDGAMTMDFFSFISADTFGAGDAGAVTVNADTLTMDFSLIASQTSLATGGGSAGTVDVNADTLSMTGNSFISSSSFGSGNAGTTIVNAGKLTVSDGSFIASETSLATGGGNAGITTITIDTLAMDNSNISSRSFGSGNAGTTTVTAGELTMTRASFISADSFFGSGNAGTVTVTTDTLSMSSLSFIQSHTFGSGDAGDVTVTADTLTMSGFSFIQTVSRGSGDGGAVTVSADTLTMTNNSFILSTTFGSGDAGAVTVTTDTLAMDDSFISDDAFGSGNAGTVSINTNMLTLTNNARISSSTHGTGNGGNVFINADRIDLTTNSGIFANSTTDTSGLAGDITIVATDTITLNNSQISTDAVNNDGGNININVENLLLLVDSKITTSVAGGLGAGGNINIDPIFVILINSQIIANAFGGPGGNITIVTDFFLQDDASIVQASSALGIDGTVIISTLDDDISGSITVLPETYLDASTLLTGQCAARDGVGSNSLVVTGSGGLPEDPGSYLSASVSDVENQSNSEKFTVIDSKTMHASNLLADLGTALASWGCGI